MNKLVKSIYAGVIMLSPVLVLAQDFDNFDSAVTTVSGWVNLLIALLIGIGVLVFVYGLIKYLASAGDEEKRKEARSLIIWGVVILFVMVSVWGLVNFLGDTLNLDNTVPEVPEIPDANS